MANRSMRADARRLILDANIMTSALLGKSFPLLLLILERGIHLMSAAHQLAETRQIVLKRSGDANWTAAQMRRLATVVEPVEPFLYARYEPMARERLDQRGQPHWPMIALAIAVDGDVWSHDKDLYGTGAPVWSTRVLRRTMETADVS